MVKSQGPPDAGARHFHDAARAVREAHQGRRGIVDLDLARAAGPRRIGAFTHEGLRLGADLGDVTDHPLRHVDEMGAQIGDGGAAHLALEAPVKRNIGIDEFVRHPDGAPVLDLADLALVDHPLHQRNGRQLAVVEADGVQDAAFLHRVQRHAALIIGSGERLFGDHRLTVHGGRRGDLGMGAGRRTNVDDVDIRAFDDPPPVGGRLGETVSGGGLLDAGLLSAADDMELGLDGEACARC
jgi:hypothetical protein